MIDHERLEKVVQAMEALEAIGIRSTADIKTMDYSWDLWAWCPVGLEEEKRHYGPHDVHTSPGLLHQ